MMQSVFKFLGTAFLTLLFQAASAQFFNKEGLRFSATIRYSYLEKQGTAGLYPAITVDAFNCTVDYSAGFSYRNKTYTTSDFDGALRSYFDAIKVTRMNIRFELTGTSCDHVTSIDGIWELGETKGNALCGITPKKKVAVLNVLVNGPTQITGVSALRQKIDELEKKAEADKKKTTAAQLLQKAEGELASKNFDQAIAAYDEALEVDPGNAKAKEGKQRAITLQNEEVLEQKKKAAIEQLYQQADALYNSGQYAQAMQRYNQILGLDPQETGASSKLREAENALEKKNKEQQVQKKKEEQTKQESATNNNKTNGAGNQAVAKYKADSALAAHKKYLNDRWREDSIYRAEQWKQKLQSKQEQQQLNKTLVDDYEKKLNAAFDRSEKQFAQLSPEEQQKRCEQAEGFASNAELMMSMKDYSSATKLFQQAALMCPTNPKVFLWMGKSVADFQSSLNEWERKQQEKEALAFQKQNLQFLEATTMYSQSPLTNLYNKYQVEQGYKLLYDKARNEAEAYTNLFYKMSDVSVKFTDPASLNNFINTRIRAVESNYTRAMNAAGLKAGAEFDKTYAQTGSVNTAAGTAAVSGAADIIANILTANSTRKQLEEERRQQLREIMMEFYQKLLDNCNVSIQQMLAGKTPEEDSRAYATFFYNYQRMRYACSNFNYRSTDWYYNTNFPSPQGGAAMTSIKYLAASDVTLSAAQRKIHFYNLLKVYRAERCEGANAYVGGWNVNPDKFLAEARAYLAAALRQNPSNADAYYLMASIEDSRPRQFSYAFTAARLGSNSGKSHFAGYMASQQTQLKKYLLELLEKNGDGDWRDVIYFQLYNQLPAADLADLISRLVTDQRTVHLRNLLENDRSFTETQVLQSLALDAIRLNKGNTASVLRFFLPGSSKVMVNGTQLSLFQLSILEGKEEAFAGFCESTTVFSQLANYMKQYEGSYAADRLYGCFAAAALRLDLPAALEYIASVNPGYLQSHPDIADRALQAKGRTKVLSWLAANKYLGKTQLNAQIFTAQTYNDVSLLLQLGTDPRALETSSGMGVLHHRLHTLYNTVQVKFNDANSNNVESLRWKSQLSNYWNQFAAMLLDKNTPIGIVANDQGTVFHTAAMIGDLQLMKRLLKGLEQEQGNVPAFLNRKNSEGETALHVAIRNKRYGAAVILVADGAGTSIKNNEGRTPLQLAKSLDMDLPDPKRLSKEEWLNLALEEAYMQPQALNKRGPASIVTHCNVLFPEDETVTAAYVAFQQKRFSSLQEVITSGYLRSAAFTKALHFVLKGAKLSSNGTYIWTVGHEREIVSLALATYESKSKSSLKATYLLSMVQPDGGGTTLDADLEVEMYYEADGRLGISVYDRIFRLTNAQLRKQVTPGATAVFYKPALFLPLQGKIEQTAFYRDYSSSGNKDGSALSIHFSGRIKTENYKDLSIRNNPEFVMVENNGKEAITVTAYWK
jgi:hypothetical protein